MNYNQIISLEYNITMENQKTDKQMVDEIVESYNQSPNWGVNALNTLTKHFLTKKTNKSKDDHNHIQAQIRNISIIRRRIYESLPPIDPKYKDRWVEVNSYATTKLPIEEQKKIHGNLIKFKFSKNVEYNNLLKTRIKNKLENDPITEYSIRESIQTARKIINNKDDHQFYDVFVSLLLVCGRRQNELWNLMVFTKTDNKYEINCKHFSKDRNNTVLDIPILIDSDTFIDTVKYIRSFDITKSPVNNYTKQINKASNRLFPNFKSSHKLRMCYGSICETLFNRKPKIQSISYVSSILGHTNTTTTVEHYNSVMSNDLKTEASITKFIKSSFP